MASTFSYARSAGSFDDGFDVSEAAMFEAAMATFPPKKNSEELRVTNPGGKADDGVDSCTDHSSSAQDCDELAVQAPDMYNYDIYDNSAYGYGVYDKHGARDYDEGDVDDLISLVLLHWGV